MPLTDDYQLILNNLNDSPSAAIYSEAPAQGYSAMDAIVDRALSLSDQRLDALRCGQSSGNAGSGMRAWGQVFGNVAHQGDRDGMQGFDLWSDGVSLGLDSRNSIANAVVGAAINYATSHVDARDPSMTDTSIDNLGLTVYADYDLGDHAFLRGLFSYAHSRNDTVRNDFGTIDTGTYGANEYTMLVKAGKTFKHGNMNWTPSVMGRWIHYNPEDYTEAGGSGQHVAQDSIDSVEIGPGIDLTWKLRSASGGWFVPSTHAGYRYDLAGDRISTTYSGGCCGTTTSFSPQPAQSRFNFGGSMTYYTTSSWELKAGYDLDLKQDFVAHTGVLRGTFRY